ncbi:basic leucine zipper 34-like [Quercus lobata]|nr:basic leucine zipper 34-like [Quercus lobata]
MENSQMPKHKKSSSSPCINMEGLNLNSQPKTLRLGHRRSASDSALASLLKTINFELGPGKSFSAEKADLSTTGVQECSHFNAPKKSPPPSNKNKSIEDDVPLVVNDSTKCESSTAAYHHKWDRKIDPGMNPKKMRRLLANRESAQRSRLRKIEYIEALEREIENEKAKISFLAPQVTYYEIQHMIMSEENQKIREMLELLEIEKAYKDAEYVALKKEMESLKKSFM